MLYSDVTNSLMANMVVNVGVNMLSVMGGGPVRQVPLSSPNPRISPPLEAGISRLSSVPFPMQHRDNQLHHSAVATVSPVKYLHKDETCLFLSER